MSQIFDFTAAGPILKQRYESKPVERGFFADRPFLADVPKNETLGGSAFQVAIKYAPMSTRAPTVPGALANGSPDQYAAFNVTNIYNDFAVVQLSGAAIDQTQGDENAMIKLLTEAFDGAYDTAYESQSRQLWGNGGGSRGQIPASGQTLSSATLTLTNVGDAVNFWGGQVIQAAPDDGSTPTTVRAGTLTVKGVDYQAGTVTFTVGLSVGISAIAASDFLFMSGDYGAGYVGLGGWNPATAPGSTLFFGVDRTKNIVGLSGWRVNGYGAGYEDTLTEMVARMCSIGALKGKKRCYMNPIDWAQFAKTQNSKVIYDRGSVASVSTPEVMFEALKMMTPKGPMDIVADVHCPQGVGRVIGIDNVELLSNGKICRPSNNWANLMWLPSYLDDIYQTRLVSRSFLQCRAPYELGVATF